MKKCLLFFLLGAILLTAGCAGPEAEVTPTPDPVATAAPEPTPTPKPPTEVTVHWDALGSDPPRTTLASRRYENYTDDLIPADDYGPLMPYIGGETEFSFWDGGWYHGLATLDGTIVTDAVFVSVSYGGYYDSNRLGTVYPEPAVLVLSKATADGRRMGLAAGDGSWYTGLIYTETLCTSREGSLMTEVGGDAVMIGWDGREVFRWSAESIPLPDYSPEEFMWHSGGISGHWFRYDYDYDYATDTRLSYFVDLRSGQVRQDVPEDWVEPSYFSNPGVIHFGGGWYTPVQNGADVRMANGEAFFYPLPKEYRIRAIDGDRVLIGKETTPNICILTDLEGNVLAEDLTGAVQFAVNLGNAPSLLVRTEYDTNYMSSWQYVLDRDGQPLLTARDGSFTQYGERLVFLDDLFYRVTDLEGNDLIRIPRFGAVH